MTEITHEYPRTDGKGRTVWACCVSNLGRRCAHESVEPVDAELFKRTAPHWNCVDYRDGMHYTPGDVCLWCGKTREQIREEVN